MRDSQAACFELGKHHHSLLILDYADAKTCALSSDLWKCSVEQQDEPSVAYSKTNKAEIWEYTLRCSSENMRIGCIACKKRHQLNGNNIILAGWLAALAALTAGPGS